jgi:hypothetical protein
MKGRSFHFQDALLYLTGLLTAQSVAQSLCLIFAWIVLDWELVRKHTEPAARKSCDSKLEVACYGQDIAQAAITLLCVVGLRHISSLLRLGIL